MATYSGMSITDADLARATEVARRRQDEAVRMGLRDRHGFTGNGYDVHSLGAIGELMVAKFLHLDWEATVNTFKQPDIGGIIQVRTRSEHWHDMIVRDDDRDDEIFIHVTIKGPECRIHGCMFGRDAKQSRWKQRHGGREAAYFVPASELHPLS